MRSEDGAEGEGAEPLRVRPLVHSRIIIGHAKLTSLILAVIGVGFTSFGTGTAQRRSVPRDVQAYTHTPK